MRMAKYKRLYVICAVILVLGLASSAAIYVAADREQEEGQQYEIIGGKIYPGGNERSKAYRHNLEVFGGKAAVLADDFNRWFESLWQGRTLAFTVGFISALTAFGFFLGGRHYQRTAAGNPPGEDAHE